jgi:hypothetical protein
LRALCKESALPLKTKQSVSFIRKFAFMFLAFAVFSLGLQARLALYKTSPNITITSAKVATENRSAQVLKSLEVRQDSQQPYVRFVFAFLLSGLHDESDVSHDMGQVAIGFFHSARSQLISISSLRRPPPTFI